MDSYRGDFADRSGEGQGYDPADDNSGNEPLPVAIGQDERRMQVRAYNHWASLLGDRAFPLIADLATGSLPDFDPYSVLLDFSGGIENPTIRYLGTMLADECAVDATAIRSLEDVPSRSLLSRITDHYLQIHANQAPIGFEAEFVNQSGRTILYRGILLPFSGAMGSGGIDLIYGVINWKELADQATTDALLAEIDRALEPGIARGGRSADAMVDWADGPADQGSADMGLNDMGLNDGADILDLIHPLDDGIGFDGAAIDGPGAWPLPAFGNDSAGSDGDCADSLADCLAQARALASQAQGSEDRTRQALYAAIGRAWDFALAAAAAPQEFRELLEDAGLTMQDRAPFTPVAKLVFGADHDKTRLTEYAAAMAHAQRQGLGTGELAAFLARAAGGLKGVVHTERRLRREESGKPAARRDNAREALASRLRTAQARPLADLPATGEEFALVMVRRTETGEILTLGEITEDTALLERAARRLLG